MSAVALDGRAAGGGGRDVARWAASFALVLGLHVAAIALLPTHRDVVVEQDEALPAVTVDLAPPPSAPIVAPPDAALPSEAVPERMVPDPVVPDPPPTLETETPPAPPPPVPPRDAITVPAAPKPLPRPVERVVERKPPKPVEAPRGEPREERRPPAREAGAATTAPLSVSSGASAASRASWQGALVAHLRRHLLPQNGQNGAASVRFTMTRSGSVTSTALAGSAGSPALDAEALAVFRRAQPLPAAPADVPGASFTFTIPIRFTAR